MSVHRIAGRYAKSLIDLAKEQGNLEVVLEDISTFVEMCKNRDLTMMLKSPIINTTKKASIFKILFGDKFQVLTNAFFNIVLKKGREDLLPEIAVEFVRQYKELKGITTVKVTTATPMNEENLKSIKSKLLSSDITGKEVEIESKVDPNILGGFIVEIGDKLFDDSVAFKLKQLKKQFAGSEYIKQ